MIVSNPIVKSPRSRAIEMRERNRDINHRILSISRRRALLASRYRFDEASALTQAVGDLMHIVAANVAEIRQLEGRAA